MCAHMNAHMTVICTCVPLNTHDSGLHVHVCPIDACVALIYVSMTLVCASMDTYSTALSVYMCRYMQH